MKFKFNMVQQFGPPHESIYILCTAADESLILALKNNRSHTHTHVCYKTGAQGSGCKKAHTAAVDRKNKSLISDLAQSISRLAFFYTAHRRARATARRTRARMRCSLYIYIHVICRHQTLFAVALYYLSGLMQYMYIYIYTSSEIFA